MYEDIPCNGQIDETDSIDIRADCLFTPSELFHENSKLRPSDRSLFKWIYLINSSPQIRQIISRPCHGYRGYPSIPLQREFPPSSRSLDEVVKRRRSVRQFSGEPISLIALAKLLLLGDGVVANSKTTDGSLWALRTAPSGGGLYPIELYCVITRVDGLVPGLYSYDPSAHCLKKLLEQDLTEALIEATYLGEIVKQACVCIITSVVFPRVKFKYGERGYRFALLEAGHIAQNLLLASEDEGLGAVPLGGFVDDKINEILNVDGVDEAAVYMVLIGGK